MRKILPVILVSGLLLFNNRSEGQVANYVFSATGGTYTPVSGGTEIFDLQDDDELTSSIPIGFNFVYNGVAYSQVQACSNGWLSFITSQSTAFYDNTLANSNTIRPALYPLWDDLDGFWEGQNFYQTSGVFPNRIFTFEWRSFDWQIGALDDVISFQVKLFEGTNNIQFVYRQEAGAVETPDATIGISGTTSGDYLVLNNTSASPTASSSIFTMTINSKPATGQIYQFAPPACGGTPAGGTTVSTASPVCAGASFTLSITGSVFASGLSYQWQSSPDGSAWTDIGGATSATYTTSIGTSTWFRRATICTGTGYSSGLQVVVTRPATTVTPGNVCVNSSSILTANAAAGTTTILNENFNGAATGWTMINNTTGGSSPASAAWTLRPDGYSNTGGTTVYTFHSNDNSQFCLTNADAIGSGGTPNVSTILQSPSFNTTGYSSCQLQFYHHYKDFSSHSETAKVDISTDATSWTNLATYSGTDQGSSTGFLQATINLPAGFVGQPTVYIRFKYDAAWDWFWAVDNVTVTGTPTTATYSWTVSPSTGAGLPAAATVPATSNTSITVTPTVPGIFTYSVTSSNSCLSPASVNITATVGSLVTASVCQSLPVVTGDNYVLVGSCQLLAKIVPQGPMPVTGNVNTCVTIDPTVQFYNGQPYVQRHYDIEPAVNASTSTAAITLYVTQAEFDAVNTADALAGNNWPDLPTWPGDVTGISAVKVTQWHGSPTASPSSPGTYPDPYAILVNPVSVIWNAPDARWEIKIHVVGFSGFFIHTGFGYPLPVALISFNGHREASGNLLNWTVASEQLIRGYSIERSYDGQHFTAVGFVNSIAPGGNSSSALQYHFTDNNFTGDKQYYRLRQRGLDGREKISTVLILNGTKAGLLTINGLFPNPANSVVNVMLESPGRDKLDIIVTDIMGRTVLRKTAIAEPGSNTIPLTIEQIVKGIYFIKISGAAGYDAVVNKFVKQ